MSHKKLFCEVTCKIENYSNKLKSGGKNKMNKHTCLICGRNPAYKIPKRNSAFYCKNCLLKMELKKKFVRNTLKLNYRRYKNGKSKK